MTTDRDPNVITDEDLTAARKAEKEGRRRRAALAPSAAPGDRPKTVAPTRVAAGETPRVRQRRAQGVEVPREPESRWSLVGVPRRYDWARLAADAPLTSSPAFRAAWVRLVAFARARKDPGALVFVGAAGAGKTSLATAVLREVTERPSDARRLYRIARWMPARVLDSCRQQHGLGEGEAKEIRDAIAADVLLLDDLGAYARGAVEAVVCGRHDESKTTWITTGLLGPAVVDGKPQSAAARAASEMARIYGDGVARRLFEGATVIDCGKVGRP